jgi:hypothetical protein
VFLTSRWAGMGRAGPELPKMGWLTGRCNWGDLVNSPIIGISITVSGSR